MVIKQINSKNPDLEIIAGAVEMLKSGKIIVYPTDTIYGIGCDILNKRSVESIQKIKDRKKPKPLSIICSDLKDISRWAIVSNSQYKILKKYLPGAFTFILKASSIAPKILQDPKRKTIGIRIPDNGICLELTKQLGNPIITTSVNLTGGKNYINPDDIKRDWYGRVDLILDAGELNNDPSTIVSLIDDNIEILRQGKGIFDF
ncbi:MAG: L-threonylcarbamoyladenylate synthase [Patescibacteria group bacterium]|nr:L-threonylcarbamoyladenylate synthase [Patescibacteria group bacterium]